LRPLRITRRVEGRFFSCRAPSNRHPSAAGNSTKNGKVPGFRHPVGIWNTGLVNVGNCLYSPKPVIIYTQTKYMNEIHHVKFCILCVGGLVKKFLVLLIKNVAFQRARPFGFRCKSLVSF